MKEKLLLIVNSFRSKDGLIVLKTLFFFLLFLTTIEIIFTDVNNAIVGIFAIFTILLSVLIFQKKIIG